jgi:hypothetical protein
METKMNATFFEMFRKKGFYHSLSLLSAKPILRTAFFDEIKKQGYLNEFFRAKDDLLKHGLIAFSLSPLGEYQIAITEKGLSLRNKIVAIDTLIMNEYPNE